MTETDWLAVDVGNSAIKVAHVRCDAASGLTVESVVSVPTTATLPAFPFAAAGWPAALCSVRRERGDEVVAWVARATGVPPYVFGADGTYPLRVDYETPETLGADRVLACFAASLETSDAIVIDAGSALTVDLLRDGVFCGGAIAPGLRSWLSVLRIAAPALTFGALAKGVPWPGRSSEQSCTAGASLSAKGQIAALVQAARAVAKAGCPLIVTGGDAPLVMDLVEDPQVRHAPHLLLEGLVVAGRGHNAGIPVYRPGHDLP